MKSGNPDVEKTLGDNTVQYLALGKGALQKGISKSRFLAPGTEKFRKALGQKATVSGTESIQPGDLPEDKNSLLLGYPIGLIGTEESVFGGVITRVSNREDENLGMLKLADLPALHVRTAVTNIETPNPVLVLLGCVENCSETSPREPLLGIPVVGIDPEQNLLILDLAPLASELELNKTLDPNGEYTQMKTKSAATTAFDFSVSTLVFDVDTNMIPKDADENDPNVPVTTVTIRWYLKLSSAFNSAFKQRAQTQGVGYFTTLRSADERITRFPLTANAGGTPVHYFIKNVPAEHLAAFTASFDGWNTKLEPVLGRKLISYDVIAKDDPNAELLVAGDVRYNILEWDLINQAPYGGLGPSIANQFTGELFSANVLIQGPTIIQLYTEWFKVAQGIAEQEEQGNTAAAEKLLRDFNRYYDAKMAQVSGPKLALKFGKKTEFRINSQRPDLRDPIMQRPDFDLTPPGTSYETYMAGYFQEMVEHELGHNLGLRHNFRGNLGHSEMEVGKVSRSVMEYLSRPYRWIDRIAEYDLMAIGYGYTGKAPEHLDWFCTDEEGVDPTVAGSSAECTNSDATDDPFGFFEKRLSKAIDYLTARGKAEAPTWTVADMPRELGVAVNGMSSYAFSAATSPGWTNFFGKPGRPAPGEEVRGYVVSRIKAQVCDPGFAGVLAAKADETARAKTQANIEALRAVTAQMGADWGIEDFELKCPL